MADKVDTHTLGADQLHHLHNLLHQSLGCIRKQQMRFIKEENHPRLIRIAYFRQSLKQLCQHPQQEGAIDSRAVHQALCVQHIDEAAAVRIGTHPIADIQSRFTEKLLTALVFKGQ